MCRVCGCYKGGIVVMDTKLDELVKYVLKKVREL